MLAKKMLLASLVAFLTAGVCENVDAQRNNQGVPTLPPTTNQQGNTLVPPTNIQSAPVQGTQRFVVPKQGVPQQQQRFVQPQQGFPQQQPFKCTGFSTKVLSVLEIPSTSLSTLRYYFSANSLFQRIYCQ